MATKTRQNGASVPAKRVRKALHSQGADKDIGALHGFSTRTAAQIIRYTGGRPCMVRPSGEGMMASYRECYSLLVDSRTRKAWRERHLTFLGMTDHGYRVFSLVDVVSLDKSARFLMDAITGTFYDPNTGFCHTSDRERIRHLVFVDDIKPFMKAGADYSYLPNQFGVTRYGRNYGG